MNDSIKSYFDHEVLQITPPPMPFLKPKKRIKPWENIILTAVTLTSMVILYLPASYNSKIRNLEFNENNIELLKERTTRVISEVDRYYLEKRGVNNE